MLRGHVGYFWVLQTATRGSTLLRMRERIILLLALLLPFAAHAIPVEKKPAKAVRVGNYVYLKLPRALVNTVRSPGWAEDSPKWVASIGEFKISPLRSLIRAPGNILTAVDAEGQTREVEANKDEILLLRDLGAKPAGKFGYSLKRFLRLEIENPGKSLVIESGEDEHRFAVVSAP